MVETGVPQGSPVSPILFALFLSGLFPAVTNAVPDTDGLSFVDDVGWTATGGSIQEITDKLSRCAERASEWADKHAAQFDIEKTEAILLSRKRDTRERAGGFTIRVGTHEIPYNTHATR